MKDRSIPVLLILLGIVIGSVSVALGIVFVRSRTEARSPEPPKLAGQAVPSNLMAIDFTRPYDLFCRPQENSNPTVFRNVTILGFTGNQRTEKTGKGAMDSYEYSYFEKWLALQYSDKRKIFIPKESILWFEESK